MLLRINSGDGSKEEGEEQKDPDEPLGHYQLNFKEDSKGRERLGNESPGYVLFA